MKTNPIDEFILDLNRLVASLDLVSNGASRSAALKSVDNLIAALNRIRQAMTDEELACRIAAVRPAITQVLEFVESSKADPRLCALLAITKNGPKVKKREPLEIPANLSNQQIRERLQREPSLQELRAIAAQRAIPVHKANRHELKHEILENLERQEGYERLAVTN